MKNVVILGSSGSIGENALRVARTLKDRTRITGLAVNTDFRRVLKQADQFGVKHVAVANPEAAAACAARAPRGVTVHRGAAGLEELAALGGTDIVLCAVVGMAGLRPVLAALRNHVTVALATKEVLVSAGPLVRRLCLRNKVDILPVDSEHSAIFQCLAPHKQPGRATSISGCSSSNVGRLILTASGGPFASRHDLDLDKVTVDEALKHPRWNMGRKVTVDSATLMNKGLEIMEAHWLFDVPYRKIDVVIHPESIIHSMVEFLDGSVLAQMSLPDMRFAIQYALTHPDRVEGRLPRLDMPAIKHLHFMEPDSLRFPCLSLARRAATAGGTLPTVLNAANEIAVEKFLAREVCFSGIWRLVEETMSQHSNAREPDAEDIVEADRWARARAGALSKKLRT